MSNLKSYLGSVVLAGLLLQGCGGGSTAEQAEQAVTETNPLTEQRVASYNASTNAFANASSEDQAQATSDLTMKFLSLYETDADIKTLMDKIIAENDSITTVLQAAQSMAEAMMVSSDTTAASAPQRSILSGITDSVTGVVGDTIVAALDTSVGDAVTTAAFDVVLNSEGITIVMIDLARGSEPLSEIMVNSMEADWSLAEKMCPMLRESVEFGDKFTALAEEQDIVGRFFFERIDANMYGCLTDAMLLSNRDYGEDGRQYENGDPVKHSTNAYMGLLMDRYATDYFVTPDASYTGLTAGGAETSDVRRNDKFVSLLLDTGAAVDYNSTTKTFEGHGDGNELINEKFFYSLFKTPGTTNSFVDAMDKVKTADATNATHTLTLLMDNIFLGQPQDTTAAADKMQGELNIISIGSAMYDGIYGDNESNRTNGYGFASYTGAFIGFAGLIPSDRYMTYAKAFMNAGYTYAEFHGIDLWSGVSEAAQTAWNDYTASDANTTTAAGAPSRSGGLGLISSPWSDDIYSLVSQAWDNLNITGYLASSDDIITYANNEATHAYYTVVTGVDENNDTLSTTLDSSGETVNGFHGLIELALQEDLNDTAFVLPPLSDLTWSYAYNTASDGAMAYYDNNVNADWFADLSSNELIRAYFYPSADNVYIPSWMLAIDWLKVANNYNTAEIATTDFDFNAGYFDVYVTSTNPNILVANSEIDLVEVISSVKTITVTKVDMGSDSIIAVDADGKTIDGLNLYKVRTISPEDTQAVLAYLSTLGDSALTAIGLDSSNAATVDTTDANATAAN